VAAVGRELAPRDHCRIRTDEDRDWSRFHPQAFFSLNGPPAMAATPT
jgi:hypothetical protein